MRVVAYQDSSGDEGFKFDRGSSHYYVVAIVLTSRASCVSRSVERLRRSLRQKRFYFHFSDLSGKQRKRFFEHMINADFRVRLFSVDKRIIFSPTLLKSGAVFRTYMTRLPLQVPWLDRSEVLLVIDGDRFREAEAPFPDDQYWLGQFNLPPVQDKIAKMYFHSAQENDLLQVADMFAGAARAQLERGDNRYQDYLKLKVEDWYHFKQQQKAPEYDRHF